MIIKDDCKFIFLALALIYQKVIKKMGPISRIAFRDILHSGLDYTENLPHLLVDRVFSTIDKKDLSSVMCAIHICPNIET